LDNYIPDFDDGEDMLEIDKEEDVVEVRGRQALLGKGNASATSASKVSSMGNNMRLGSSLSKRSGLMDAFLAFDPTIKVAKDDRRRKLR